MADNNFKIYLKMPNGGQGLEISTIILSLYGPVDSVDKAKYLANEISHFCREGILTLLVEDLKKRTGAASEVPRRCKRCGGILLNVFYDESEIFCTSCRRVEYIIEAAKKIKAAEENHDG